MWLFLVKFYVLSRVCVTMDRVLNCLLDLLKNYTHATLDYTSQITDTQTSVLSLFKSPLAVSWQTYFNSLTKLYTQNVIYEIFYSQADFQLSTLATNSRPFHTNLLDFTAWLSTD
jgi:uncharacterized UPF0160 family protein